MWKLFILLYVEDVTIWKLIVFFMSTLLSSMSIEQEIQEDIQ